MIADPGESTWAAGQSGPARTWRAVWRLTAGSGPCAASPAVSEDAGGVHAQLPAHGAVQGFLRSSRHGSRHGRAGLARFLIEDLRPSVSAKRRHANRPLPLDDPESVWWVAGGQVDVFFTLPGSTGARTAAASLPGGGGGLDLRHQRGPGSCGRRLMAVGVGTARLLRFARGDLIRLGFEERLAEQAAVLHRRFGSPRRPRAEPRRWLLPAGRTVPTATELAQGRGGAPRGSPGSAISTELPSSLTGPLPVNELEARFPLSEHLWLTSRDGLPGDRLGHRSPSVRTGDPWPG